MEPYEKRIMERMLELTEKNHKMIRKMYIYSRISGVISLIYWLILIGAAIGLFYFLDPFYKDAKSVYTNFKGNVEMVNDLIRN